MCVCACVCVSERERKRWGWGEREDTIIVPLYCLMAYIQFTQVCFYSHLSHCFKPSLFLSLQNHRNSFSGYKAVSLLSLPVISVPASLNCAIFQQEFPLLSVALSLKLLQGEE